LLYKEVINNKIHQTHLSFLFLEAKLFCMKKLFFPIMIVAAFMAFYEQGKSQPNKYITIISIAVFMLGLMQLMSKVPSKKTEEEESFVKSDRKKDFKIEEKSRGKEPEEEV